jgi:D-glycero-beta-D-manno-heptose-7-phosphate kinase
MKLDIIKSFGNKKILLVGDAILDVYIYGNVAGQALDAPVPEVEERKVNTFFGGNGLVASHILELGGHLTFITVLGADEDSKHYDSFVHPRLKKIFLIDDTRRTTVKKRWYDGWEKLLQVNKVDNHNISASLEKKLSGYIEKEAKNVDVIVVMDPQHGLLTKSLITKILEISDKYKKPLYVDVQISHRPSNHHLYRGADTMFLNQREAKAVYPKFDMKNAKKSLEAIQKKLTLRNVVVKLGGRGLVALFGKEFIHVKPFKVKAIDVCGAGDAFLAAFSLGDRSRPEESLEIANIWGALSTTIHGTIPSKKKDLIRFLKNE